MGFLLGSSCFLHSPLHQSLFSNPLNQSFFSFSSPSRRNAHKHRNQATTMACSQQDTRSDIDFCRRKAIVFMGLALIPLLNINTQPAQAFLAEDSEEKKQKASSNSILSLINGVGVFSTGILGALYALAQKEKSASNAIIESMTSKLKVKDKDILSMQKKFETELLNEQEVRNQELKRSNLEKQALVDELASAFSTITNLGNELQNEKRLAMEIKFEVESLENNLKKAGEEKTQLQEKLKEKLESLEVLQGRINLLSSEVKHKEDNLHSLGLVLSEKDTEFLNLSLKYEKSRDLVKDLESEINELKDAIVEYKSEIEIKNASVNLLNAQVTSLLHEKDGINRKLDELNLEYNELRTDSDAKGVLNGKLLEEREKKVKHLEEQLRFAHEEDRKNKLIISDFTHEIDDMRKLFDIGAQNVKNLEHELKITQVNLEKSKIEASDLEKAFHQSRNLNSKLESELIKVKDEFSKAKESLQMEIDKARADSDVLLNEVSSGKNVIKKMNEELQNIVHELASVKTSRDSLQISVFEADERVRSANIALEKEKKKGEVLEKEMRLLESEILKEKEKRKSLDEKLDETTRSLEETNRSALSFGKELELASLKILSVEEEKEILYKSLNEQKQISYEARENLEDAHNLVMRLGKERESLEKKGVKLEEELASAKGEILRLRSLSKVAPVNNLPQKEVEVEAKEKEVVPVKRTRRRKVATPPPENDAL